MAGTPPSLRFDRTSRRRMANLYCKEFARHKCRVYDHEPKFRHLPLKQRSPFPAGNRIYRLSPVQVRGPRPTPSFQVVHWFSKQTGSPRLARGGVPSARTTDGRLGDPTCQDWSLRRYRRRTEYFAGVSSHRAGSMPSAPKRSGCSLKPVRIQHPT